MNSESKLVFCIRGDVGGVVRGWFRAHVFAIWRLFCQTPYICFLIFEPVPPLVLVKPSRFYLPISLSVSLSLTHTHAIYHSPCVVSVLYNRECDRESEIERKTESWLQTSRTWWCLSLVDGWAVELSD